MPNPEELKKQIEITERLQTALLEHFETLLKEKTITSTDMATLTRLLSQNGWSLDPAKLPQSLRGLLTTEVDPKDLDDQDVIPITRAG